MTLFKIKEEPTDAQPISQTQCKLLNRYTLQWTNLTYICISKKVLRTKPLEGGDDIRMGADVPVDALAGGCLKDFLKDCLTDVLNYFLKYFLY